MPNTNFQTIFQMGQAINDMVKQATGRDVVQTIEMGQVTVAQNHLSVERNYSGESVSFVANNVYPMQIVADINPVQDLHGYEYPWPAGGGKNKLPITISTTTIDGVTFTVNDDGTISTSGTATANINLVINQTTTLISGESYKIGGCAPGSDGLNYFLRSTRGVVAGATTVGFGNPATATDETLYLFIHVENGTNMNGLVFKPMICLASETDYTFAPYSNICPITGWTGAEITVANGDDPTAQGYDAETYTITFPEEVGTVYGGTLTVNKDGTGTLVIEWANIASYDGEELPGVWISDRDVYAEGTTPTTGAQVVYELAEPVTVTLEAEVVETLIGENVVSADTGNITVSYDEIIEGGGN